MCNLYTKAFVKTAMLDSNGRETYQQMPESIKSYVDRKRAVNEIALVNRETGSVTYGVQSLFLVLAHRFPTLKHLFRLRFFAWIADKAYKFISYNRRVIVPAAANKQSGAHIPAFRKDYRVAYLIFAWLVTAFILHQYSLNLLGLLPASTFVREMAACGGQIIWQLAAIQLFAKQRCWDYLGNMMTISLAGAILLGLISLVGILFSIQQPLFYFTAFGLVVFCMLLEHVRRTRILHLGWALTASWILYRVLLLMVIL
jgi:hypothetical protein